ncbi:alpha/beta-hydrolase [Nadsonia fulvescens var. elongata DSM 6958]|uniref:Kynurenine formamidase n=1 Tax=Nadsonia fulvescens var. elongata DSM 6958 TaxID=857566 RepID=A0A1E3PE60_9ASCO|nr:alpha/beta-hydrolase [Nadsonia fulvescens var. elongata DSM 6958]
MSEFSIVKYGNHALQQISVLAHHDSNTAAQIPPRWVIYIHGGAWRDPNNNHKDGHHLIRSLCNSDSKINGASIDYRLSPEVTHPGHIDDVIAALQFLIKTYNIKDYILVGHSAGAFLAVQSLIFSDNNGDFVLPPKVLVGVEGIYDLRVTVEEEASYNSFVSLAFGDNKNEWDLASPASGVYQLVTEKKESALKDDPKEIVYKGKVVCVHSSDDELLSLDYQPKNLEKIVNLTEIDRRVSFENYIVSGKHDEVFGRAELVQIVSKYLCLV